MPSNWPDLALAIALALVRGVHPHEPRRARNAVDAAMRIVPEDHGGTLHRPRSRHSLLLFLIIRDRACRFPRSPLAGYKTSFSRDRTS
jgi:hypothetical protein